jgi:hypothetical protein
MSSRNKTWWAVPVDVHRKVHLVDVFGSTGTKQSHIMACGAVIGHFDVIFSLRSWRVDRCAHCERIRASRAKRIVTAEHKYVRRRNRFALDTKSDGPETGPGCEREQREDA